MLYLATLSGHSYWLDSGEFVAASLTLGVAHPPGHPLAALVGNFFSWLPLGAHSFRVALASAVMASLASYYLYQTTRLVIRIILPRAAGLSALLALAATWWTVFCFGWWFQALRPEVYALQAALLFFALYRILLFEGRWPQGDARHLYAAALALGLAVANHHLLAFLFIIPFAPLALRVRAQLGWSPIRRSLGAFLAGCATYVYLPLRALSDPMVNLGDPSSWGRFIWVVSAQVFQKNSGSNVPESMTVRSVDILETLGENLHWPVIALALGGIYVGIRLPKTRRIFFTLVPLVLLFIVMRIWLGFSRGNPDAQGYLMLALGGLSCFAAAFLAVIASFLLTRSRKGIRARRLSLALGWALVAGSLVQVPAHYASADLSRFHATDDFDHAIRRELPPGSVLIVHSPQLIFRYWGGESSELARPDVVLVPVPFLGYPGMVDSLMRREPALGPFLRGFLLTGELRQPDLQTLSASRPVLVEMDPQVGLGLYDTLAPAGFFHQVLSGGSTSGDCQEGAETQRATMEALYRSLSEDQRDPETRNQLLWRHYVNSLYYLGFGARTEARLEVPMALRISPESAELQAMQELLRDEEARGPVDIRPFLLGARD